MSDWRPIETAPKDGTSILLWGGQDDNADYVSDEIAAKMSSPARAWWDGDCWLMTLAEAGCVGVEYINPTHWMPLPAQPCLATQEG